MQNNIFSAESLSQNIIVLDQVDSTNDYLKSKLSNFKPLPELTAIMAKHQTHGRGQRDNNWLTSPNLN
ncbi:MAG: biotin--[acetyl-CoA-carboxylase] ligase, partial [Sphingobacterium sp.]